MAYFVLCIVDNAWFIHDGLATGWLVIDVFIACVCFVRAAQIIKKLLREGRNVE